MVSWTLSFSFFVIIIFQYSLKNFSCDNLVKDKIQDILCQALLVRADCTGELCDKRATRKYQSILISDNN